jgi:hypothetical protein
LQNPEAARAIMKRAQGRRDSRKRGAAVVERISYTRIMRRDAMRCHLCRKKVAGKQLEFDHVIPLAAGGEHTERNIAVSHRHCNRVKSAKVLTLF